MGGRRPASAHPPDGIRALTGVRGFDRLAMLSLAPETASADEHALRILSDLESQRARCVVIDPLSALERAGGAEAAGRATVPLVHGAKAAGCTVFVTSLLESAALDEEATAAGVSTIADTWVHMSNVVAAGERNRAITIVKSRGTAHSSQVRELVLSRRGVTLADVFTTGGEVLMGTLRWEREEKERAAARHRQRETAARIAALEADLEESAAHMRKLEAERKRRVDELQVFKAEREAERQRSEEAVRTVRRLRGGARRGRR